MVWIRCSEIEEPIRAGSRANRTLKQGEQISYAQGSYSAIEIYIMTGETAKIPSPDKTKQKRKQRYFLAARELTLR